MPLWPWPSLSMPLCLCPSPWLSPLMLQWPCPWPLPLLSMPLWLWPSIRPRPWPRPLLSTLILTSTSTSPHRVCGRVRCCRCHCVRRVGRAVAVAVAVSVAVEAVAMAVSVASITPRPRPLSTSTSTSPHHVRGRVRCRRCHCVRRVDRAVAIAVTVDAGRAPSLKSSLPCLAFSHEQTALLLFRRTSQVGGSDRD
jgi:hypothetical protein